MKIVNLWESKLKNHFIFTNNEEEVFEAIKNRFIRPDLFIKDTYTPGDIIESHLMNVAHKNDLILNFTDENHLVCYSKDGYGTYINPLFFAKYKDKIIKLITETIYSTNLSHLTIPNWLFSDDLFEYVINNKNISVTFKDIKLDDEKIKRLKEHEIDAYLQINGERKQISSKYIFLYYTKEKFKSLSELSISLKDLKDEDFDNLIYLPDNCEITIKLNSTNELDYLNSVKQFLDKLDKLDKNFTIKIKVIRRSNFKKVFDNKYNNLNLIIDNDSHDYEYDEYIEEEKKLEELVEPIKNANLSPLEKYLGVYNIVKNFKKYKESENNTDESRYLRYILNGEYIVCVGYAKLLVELLDKVGIKAITFSTDVDTSYDDGFTLEEKTVEFAGHRRVIVSIDDYKYNVHGLYMADPTWDNSLDNNLLNHALMTYDKMQISRRMFSLNNFNIILDIHNFKEFNAQVNFFLKKYLKRDEEFYSRQTSSYQEIVLKSYKDVCNSIINSIITEECYEEFINLLKDCKVENDYINLLTKLGNYLLTRTNNYIKDEIILEASMESIRKTKGYEESKLREIEEMTKKQYKLSDEYNFPYQISNNNDFDLETKEGMKR